MTKFRVPFESSVAIFVEVEADNKEEAIELAYKKVHLSSFVGNGGKDKLIGVSGENISISTNDVFDVDEEAVEEI